MEKIAVLGPRGTYTEKAANVFASKKEIDAQMLYFPTMKKTFHALESNQCTYGVFPIENTLDGYVQIILDLLSNTKLKVIYEIKLKVEFAFVSNTKNLEELERVFVQFKSNNQCLDYLEKYHDKVVITDSNSATFDSLINGGKHCGAIIPMHLLGEKDFEYVEEHVADRQDNETRFLIITNDLNQEIDIQRKWKTSLVVYGDKDRPGLLADILSTFARADVNMISIMSRPTKSGLGNYNFFIDVDGCYQKDQKVKDAILQIEKSYKINVLGSYYLL